MHTHQLDGFPSVCHGDVLLSLVNKEAALAYGRAEYSKAGNSSTDKGGKKAELERCQVAAEGERGNKPRSSW